MGYVGYIPKRTPRFQQRHYNDIANALNKIAKYGGAEPRAGLALVVSELIEVFKEDNPNFQPEKFRSVVYDLTRVTL